MVPEDAPRVPEEGDHPQVGHARHHLLQLTHAEAHGLGQLDRQPPELN